MPEGDAIEHVVSGAMTKREKKLVVGAARHRGQSISQFVRTACLAEVKAMLRDGLNRDDEEEEED